MNEQMFSDIESSIHRLNQLEDIVFNLQTSTSNDTDMIMDHGQGRIKDDVDLTADPGAFGEYVAEPPSVADSDDFNAIITNSGAGGVP